MSLGFKRLMYSHFTMHGQKNIKLGDNLSVQGENAEVKGQHGHPKVLRASAVLVHLCGIALSQWTNTSAIFPEGLNPGSLMTRLVRINPITNVRRTPKS